MIRRQSFVAIATAKYDDHLHGRPAADFTRELLGSLNHTIGVRIPNSTEERQVAGVGASPVTTVPVRYQNVEKRPPVTSFSDALGIFAERIAAIGGAPWCAIEGMIQDQLTSTVVEILGEKGSYAIKRPGAIPETDIQACAEGGDEAAERPGGWVGER